MNGMIKKRRGEGQCYIYEYVRISMDMYIYICICICKQANALLVKPPKTKTPHPGDLVDMHVT